MIFSKKGFSLVEILVAVGLFSIMMVFITQILRLNLRQKTKIDSFISHQREVSGALDIMSQDFIGANSFFDFHTNLQEIHNSLTADKPNPKSSGFIEFSDEFDFLGKENQVEFSSFSFGENKGQGSFYQQVYVRYFVEECTDLKTEEKTPCLTRALLDSQNENEVKRRNILLRQIKSFKLSYYDSNKKEWKREWEAQQKNLEVEHLLPASVKVEIEWGSEKKPKKISHSFMISHPLVRNQSRQLSDIILAYENHIQTNKKNEEKKQIKPDPNKKNQFTDPYSSNETPSPIQKKAGTNGTGTYKNQKTLLKKLNKQ